MSEPERFDAEFDEVRSRYARRDSIPAWRYSPLNPEVLARVQRESRVWMSGTTWDGRKAVRLSVSNWQTTREDVELAVAQFARAVGAPVPTS